jgi:hypothetical protein
VYQDRFAAFVANTHFWGNLYNVSQPADCYYGPNTPTAPVAPPALASLDLSKFAGRWWV